MEHNISFEDYYNNSIIAAQKLPFNYLGINRKEFPKWAGWKIISNYKEKNIDVKDIEDEHLNVLVHNFYYLKYLTIII